MFMFQVDIAFRARLIGLGKLPQLCGVRKLKIFLLPALAYPAYIFGVFVHKLVVLVGTDAINSPDDSLDNWQGIFAKLLFSMD